MADMPISLLTIINPTFIGFDDNSSQLVSSVLLCFSLITTRVINLPEWTEPGLKTGSDQTVLAVHSCNSCLLLLLLFFKWSENLLLLPGRGVSVGVDFCVTLKGFTTKIFLM